MCRDSVSSDPKISNNRPCHHWKNSKSSQTEKFTSTMQLCNCHLLIKMCEFPAELARKSALTWERVSFLQWFWKRLKMNFRTLQKTASRRDVFTWKDSNCRAGRKNAQVITTVFTVCSVRLQLRLCFILSFFGLVMTDLCLHCFSTSIQPPVCFFLELGTVNRRWRPHVRVLMLSSLVLQ